MNSTFEIAKDLKTCMDTTVNPCDDFYKFTCGNFLKEAKIPEDKESITTFSEADDKLNKKLRGELTLMLEKLTNESDKAVSKLLKNAAHSSIQR